MKSRPWLNAAILSGNVRAPNASPVGIKRPVSTHEAQIRSLAETHGSHLSRYQARQIVFYFCCCLFFSLNPARHSGNGKDEAEEKCHDERRREAERDGITSRLMSFAFARAAGARKVQRQLLEKTGSKKLNIQTK